MRGTIDQKIIAIYMVCAFLVHSLLPFYAVYAIPQSPDDNQVEELTERASLFGEKVLICTSQGFKWVTWEELESGEHTPEQHPQYDCAICYMSAHGQKDVVLSASPVYILPPLLQTARNVWFVENPTYNEPTYASAAIRAPPYALSA